MRTPCKLNQALLLVLGTAFQTLPCAAEEFLGIEGEVDMAETVPSPTPSRVVSSTKSSSPWGFAATAGATTDAFGSELVLSYRLNEYTTTALDLTYDRLNAEPMTGERYGGRMNLVFMIPNPTFVTPFLSAGPGYLRWRRDRGNTRFDDGGSMILVGAIGLQVHLTKHFGLKGLRRQSIYMADPPTKFDQPHRREPRTHFENQVAFYFSI